MLVFIQGADSYLAKQAIDQLKAKYLAKNDGAELVEINADETLPNFADLQAVPLFATTRLAILKKVGVLSTEAQDGLAATLGNLPPTTVAVVWDQKPINPKATLAVTLSSATKTISALPLNELAARRWLVARAQELGLELEAGVISSLLAAAGSDLWFLETELAYLATAEGNQSDDTHQRQQKPDEPFILRSASGANVNEKYIYFRLTRQKAWARIGRQLALDFQSGTPFELLLGSLAAAIRKEITDPTERKQLVELLGDVDFGVKTGLVDPGDGIAILAHRLPNAQAERVHWEHVWEGLA